MRRTAALVLLLLATPSGGARAEEDADGSAAQDEKSFCRSELEVVERRQKVFEGQGLSASEIARRNVASLRDLEDCRERFRAGSRGAQQEKADREEAARRAGPDATPLERDKAYKQIRRERLAARNESSLTAEEKAELAAGMAEEMAATHEMLDKVHSRDPSFMRVVHSALACYHGERREELRNLISSEESLLKLGSGDKQALYMLRSQMRESEQVLARCKEAAYSYASGLERCTSQTIAIVARCMGIQLEGKGLQPVCEPEEIQQYVRFVK